MITEDARFGVLVDGILEKTIFESQTMISYMNESSMDKTTMSRELVVVEYGAQTKGDEQQRLLGFLAELRRPHSPNFLHYTSSSPLRTIKATQNPLIKLPYNFHYVAR